MSKGVSFLLMAGDSPASPPEQMVARVRRAVASDTLAKALKMPGIGQVIVATADRELAGELAGLPPCGDKPLTLDFDPARERFHFGRRLLALVEKYELERVFYMGAGSGPLLPGEEMARIAADLADMEAGVIANNLYSADFAAFVPASALRTIAPIASDNDLAWRLMADCQLPAISLPRSAATLFDVDTPGDLLILARHPSAGPQTRRVLAEMAWSDAGRRLDAAIAVLADPTAEVLVAGRVGAETWGHLERAAACRVRVVAEERGMRASGRQARGEVRSLLGYYLELVGPAAFFAVLAEMSQAAFLDTRVLLAHGLWPNTGHTLTPGTGGPPASAQPPVGTGGLTPATGGLTLATGARRWPSAADRFYSDLGQPEQIEDAWLRSFTAAALEAAIPIVMGGHSLVSGGLYALVEIANGKCQTAKAAAQSRPQP
jgi:CTP:molybdopterin cytidylyltransferase MocA